jgi:hypothetical protein
LSASVTSSLSFRSSRAVSSSPQKESGSDEEDHGDEGGGEGSGRG